MVGKQPNFEALEGFLPEVDSLHFWSCRQVRWLAALAIVLLAWLGVSTAIAYRLTRRPRAWFAEPAPRVDWGAIEEHRLHTVDGQDIGAWFVESKADDAASQVVLLHGNKGSRWNSLKRAEFLVAAGHPVLMISLRAHGDSTGEFHDIGLSARHDVVAAVEFLEHKHPGRSIVVMGVSLGSAAATFASRELGHRVHGYVLESPFQDLKTAVWNRTHAYLPPILAELGYAGLRFCGPLFLPRLDAISPLQAIDGIPTNVPVLILSAQTIPWQPRLRQTLSSPAWPATGSWHSSRRRPQQRLLVRPGSLPAAGPRFPATIALGKATARAPRYAAAK